MAEPSKRRATYDDLVAVPEHRIAEILDGELVTQSRGGTLHTRTLSCLNAELTARFDAGRGGPGGWWIAFRPEVHVGGHVLVPDLAGFRRDRMLAYPDAQGFSQAPDWVCEVLVTETAARDRVQKMQIFWREGVGHVWLVDPVLRMVEAYRREETGWRVVGAWAESAIARIEPFDAIELELADFWRL